MRIFVGVLLIVAATISTASAQVSSSSSSSMGNGSPADAGAKASAKAAAVAAGLPQSPSQSTNFSVNGDSIIRAAPPLSPEEQKANAEASAAWKARCRPTVIEDREGLRRMHYAEPDCDLSRFNTAGTQ
jgi:hypothetical protein